MKDKQWMLNKAEGERWESQEYFDTKEEAIERGVQVLKEFNGQTEKERENNADMLGILRFDPDDLYEKKGEAIYTFYVGQIDEMGIPDCAEQLLENMSEQVYYEAGDLREDYLEDVTEEDKQELTDLIQDWAIRHDYTPNCFLINYLEEIDIRNIKST